MEERIIKFIKEHHVLTLATSDNNKPYCCNCFYVYDEKENILIFTSDDDTRHVAEVRKNNNIAGSIVLETNVVGKIQGIQFTGKMFEPEKENKSKIKKTYLKKFPFAALMNTQLWYIDLEYIKMTHNKLGFGKKLIWEKAEQKNKSSV